MLNNYLYDFLSHVLGKDKHKLQQNKMGHLYFLKSFQ